MQHCAVFLICICCSHVWMVVYSIVIVVFVCWLTNATVVMWSPLRFGSIYVVLLLSCLSNCVYVVYEYIEFCICMSIEKRRKKWDISLDNFFCTFECEFMQSTRFCWFFALIFLHWDFLAFFLAPPTVASFGLAMLARWLCQQRWSVGKKGDCCEKNENRW